MLLESSHLTDQWKSVSSSGSNSADKSWSSWDWASQEDSAVNRSFLSARYTRVLSSPFSQIHQGVTASSSLRTVHVLGNTCAGSPPSPDSSLHITAWFKSWDLTDVPSIQHLPFPYFHSPLFLLPSNIAWQLSIWIPAELQKDGWINTEGWRQKKRENQRPHKVAYYPQEQEIIYRQFVPHFCFFCEGELFVFQKRLVRGLFTYILKVIRMCQNALNWFDNRHLFPSSSCPLCLYKQFWFLFILWCAKRKMAIQSEYKLLQVCLQMAERLMAHGENFFVLKSI